jgi:hypothetical protein
VKDRTSQALLLCVDTACHCFEEVITVPTINHTCYDFFRYGVKCDVTGLETEDWVSRSSTEAEHKSMADGTAKVMWVQTILCELSIPCPRNARLWCDNMGVKYLSSNPIFHGRMKHVEVDYHFIQDRVAKKLSDVRFISTSDQVTDGFMKALSQERLLEFQRNFNLIKL